MEKLSKRFKISYSIFLPCLKHLSEGFETNQTDKLSELGGENMRLTERKVKEIVQKHKEQLDEFSDVVTELLDYTKYVREIIEYARELWIQNDENEPTITVELTASEINDILNGNICWQTIVQLNSDLGADIDKEILHRIDKINQKFGKLMEKF